VGGWNVKFLATGRHQPRTFTSGDKLSPKEMVFKVREQTKDWRQMTSLFSS
jgi:hypothetical protein